MIKLLEIATPGQHSVVLSCASDPVRAAFHDWPKFSVIYGKDLKQNLTPSDAAHELGVCIIHALECNGWVQS